METKVKKVSKDNNRVGGIDFNANKMKLQVRNDARGIRFFIDPAMLRQYQDISGFDPEIINIQPLKNLPELLDLN
jgi:hypothetical protein